MGIRGKTTVPPPFVPSSGFFFIQADVQLPAVRRHESLEKLRFSCRTIAESRAKR
jgi:hypothetical protein